jgi:phenylpropionate dioxygenase-like ring-hydroxylating dioxygenase large terminal subunit
MGQTFPTPKSSEPSRDGVPFKVTDPQRIPAERYYDKAFFELERERFWPHVWQMACRLEEIPEVGDWVEYKILDWSVILVRTRTGVKAFHNACRHRGVKLADGHGSCEVQGFICPFHGWRWNIEGENTFVYARHLFDEHNLEAAELNLKPCRVEFWGGCAFINFDDDAPPLLDTMKPVADLLDPRHADKLRVEWWYSAILPTNWKLAMEAFMEGYHLMRTHPQLYERQLPLPGYDRYAATPPPPTSMSVEKLIDLAIAGQAELSVGMAGMVHANDIAIMRDIQGKVQLPDDPQAAMMAWYQAVNAEITQRNRARGVDFPDLNQLPFALPVQFIFPHYFLLPLFGNASSYRIRPLGPETCLFEIWSLVLYPEGETRERPVAPVPLRHDDPGFPPVPQQDYSNLPRQQEGLHARGFEYMRLASSVEGMISNYQRVLDGFLEGRDKQTLVKGIEVACGGLDDPIKDVGF